MFFPLYFKTDQLPCLIVGGGSVAAGKIELLLDAGCALTVIAPAIDEGVREASVHGLLSWRPREYRAGDCRGFRLVVAATPHAEVNRTVSQEAQDLGIPINVVDAPELCTVIFGAIWRDGPLTVAVSSGGIAPFMAAAVRNRIADAAAGMGSWIDAAGRFRAAVRAEVSDRAEREGLYRRFETNIQRRLPPGQEQTWTLSDWVEWLEQPGPER